MRALGRIGALAGLFAIGWFQTTGPSDPPEVPRLEGYGSGTGQPPVPGWYGGRRIEGRERSFSHAPRCGFGTSLVDWRAVVADGLT